MLTPNYRCKPPRSDASKGETGDEEGPLTGPLFSGGAGEHMGPVSRIVGRRDSLHRPALPTPAELLGGLP